MIKDLKFSLIIDSKETELVHSPSGWEDTFIEWIRNIDYYGITREVGVPIIFVLEGATILREKFYTDRKKSKGQLKIEVANKSIWGYYDPMIFDLDFSTFDDRENEVEITLLESGLKDKIKSFESTDFEIPLTDSEAITILIPGIGLVEQSTGFVSGVPGFGVAFEDAFIPPLIIFNVDVVENGFINEAVTFQIVESEGNIYYSELDTSQFWFLKANNETNISIKGHIKGSYTFLNDDSVIIIQVVNENNDLVHEIRRLVIPGNDLFEIDFDFEYQMYDGEKFFFTTRGEGGPYGLPTIISITESELFISNSLIVAETECLAFRPFTVFKRLLARINGGVEPQTRSFFLNSENWKRVVITCGDAIRGIEKPVIKTNFKDFFNSFNAISGGVTFGIEGNICVLEDRNYAMSDIMALDVGEIKDFKLSVHDAYSFSSIKTGYEDQEYETEFGREEVNSLQVYTTPDAEAKKELDLISPYRADQLGIEDLRIVPIEKNTNETDKKSDNDVFIIKIRSEAVEGVYPVEGKEHYKQIEGFSARNDYYNLDLTPKKNLLRHGPWMRSVLDGFDGLSILFSSATKNKEVRTVDINDISIREKDNVNISSLGSRLFLPYQIDFTCKLETTSFPFLRTFNRGYIKFKYRGFEFTGYVLKVSYDVAKNSEREFSLLLRAGNNIKNLIH